MPEVNSSERTSILSFSPLGRRDAAFRPEINSRLTAQSRRATTVSYYFFQPCDHAGGVLPSIKIKAMRHGLPELLTQA